MKKAIPRSRSSKIICAAIVTAACIGIVFLFWKVYQANNAPKAVTRKSMETQDTLGLYAPAKKDIAMQLVSAAENSSLDWKSQYSYIEYNVEGNDKENRGYTGGIIGFTSATGDMLDLIKQYDKISPNNKLSKYILALEKVNGSSSQTGLESSFVDDWQAAATDSNFKRAQDELRDKIYFNPAVGLAKRDGLRTLGQFAYYDAAVMHGPGDSDGELISIRSEALKHAKPPAQGGKEVDYLNAFLDARKAEMLKEEGHSDTGRVDTMQRKFLREDNFNLDPPLTFSIYGDDYTIK
jgi:chitosanase